MSNAIPEQTGIMKLSSKGNGRGLEELIIPSKNAEAIPPHTEIINTAVRRGLLLRSSKFMTGRQQLPMKKNEMIRHTNAFTNEAKRDFPVALFSKKPPVTIPTRLAQGSPIVR
jgi:hypothetical protein